MKGNRSGGAAQHLLSAVQAAFRVGLRTGRAVWSERHGDRRAMLIDLDGLGVPINRIEGELGRLVNHVGPCRAVFAAAHPSLAYRARRACLVAGIELLHTKAHPQSADRALMDVGMRMRREGVTEFVVASRDGAFAALPGRVRVVVIGEDPPVSERLRSRAASLDVLPRLSARQARQRAAQLTGRR